MLTFETHNDSDRVGPSVKTHPVGGVGITYQELVARFGQPYTDQEELPEGVSYEWSVFIVDQENDERGIAVIYGNTESQTVWTVGGDKQSDLYLLLDLLRQ